MAQATNSQHLAPLASAVVVCNARDLQALPHVVDLVSAFLDYTTPEYWNIKRACELNDLWLLKRVAARESPDIDPFFKASVAAKGLVAAVRNDNLEIMSWLCSEYCPPMLPIKAIEEAAALGKLHILEWLFTNHGNAHWNQRIIAHTVQRGNVEMLKLVLPHVESAELVADFMGRAASYCYFEIVEYLHGRVLYLGINPSSSPLLKDVLRNAIYAGSLKIAQFLVSHDYLLEVGTGSLSIAACDCDLEMVQWLQTLPQAKDSTGWIDEAAGAGKLDIVQWAHENIKDDVCTVNAMDEAASQGHLHVVQWLHQNRTEGCTTRAMDDAAGTGHLDIIQWLHEHRTEGCTTAAMDIAARNGDFDVLLWLHEHRSEGCSTEAMDSAAALGRLEMVQWLHVNRTEGCTAAAMNKTASDGHLDIVQWLHENRSEGCTTDAMDDAARDGQLHVVQWLHENRAEGCTTYAMDYALSLEIVQWLHENRTEGCTERAMEHAATRGGFETLFFLHANRTEGCTENTALFALQSNYVEIFQWVCTNYPERVNLDEILDECTGPNFKYLPAMIAQLRSLHVSQ